MAFAGRVVTAVAAMLLAVIDQIDARRRKRCGQTGNHFRCDRTGFLGVHWTYIEGLGSKVRHVRITITKGETQDRLDMERRDGSRASTVFPHKGPIPHDFVHYAVERELGFDGGFWGLVDAGRHPDEVQEIAKAAGHASSKRAHVPAADFVQAIQSERIVEAFEADHWSGGNADPAGVVYMAESGCAQSLVSLPNAFDDAAVARIRSRIGEFAGRWTSLAPGQSVVLEWPAQA